MTRYGDIRRMTWRGRLSEKFYVRVVDGEHSTWRCTGFADRELAEAIVHRWQLEVITGTRTAEPASVPTADAIRMWVEQTSMGHSRRYGECLRSAARRWTAECGHLAVSEISEDVVTQYITRKVTDGKAARTVNLDLRLLRLFFSWCIERRMITRSPVSRRLRMPEPMSTPRVLDAGDDERLLAAAARVSERAYGYVLCLLTTGFRSHLAAHVEWLHVDLPACMWRIPAALLKSRREYHQPIAPSMYAWLNEHVKTAGKIFGTYARRIWPRIRKDAGVDGIKQHDLRRTFVTLARRVHVDLEVAMALSDHQDVRTMMKYYRRVNTSETKNAIDRIDAERTNHA
jgi:integrase